MAKKTAFRSLSKWLPKSVELAGALALDEQQDQSSVDFGAVLDGDASISGGGFIEGEPLDQGEINPDNREPPPLWDQIDQAHTESKPAETRRAPRKQATKDQPAPVVQTAPTSEAADAGIPQTSGVVGQEVPAETPNPAEAPAAEGGSTQSPTSAGLAFSVWLVDSEGNELPDSDGVFEPFDDPVKFAGAYKDAEGSLFPADIELFQRANVDNVQWACNLSQEAAAIFWPPAPKEESPTKATNPTLPMTMPADPWFIPPPTKSTRAEFSSYEERFKKLLAEAANDQAIDHLVMVNSPVTERSDFLNSTRLKIKAATEDKRKDLMRPAQAENHEATSRAEKLMLRVKACKTRAEAEALVKDVDLIADIRWLHANAPEIRKSTAVAMDAFVKGLPG